VKIDLTTCNQCDSRNINAVQSACGPVIEVIATCRDCGSVSTFSWTSQPQADSTKHTPTSGVEQLRHF
jgi:hypothetical protein